MPDQTATEFKTENKKKATDMPIQDSGQDIHSEIHNGALVHAELTAQLTFSPQLLKGYKEQKKKGHTVLVFDFSAEKFIAGDSPKEGENESLVRIRLKKQYNDSSKYKTVILNQ